MLTAEHARQIVSYDGVTGVFTRSGPEGSKRADYATGLGYRKVSIGGRAYLAHRLAWLIVTGGWPPEEIDHANGDPGDNRIANLREASHLENLRNTRRRVDNTSGFKGVSWSPPGKNWRVRIKHGGRYHHVGCYPTKEAAAAAYLAEADRVFGVFARAA